MTKKSRKFSWPQKDKLTLGALQIVKTLKKAGFVGLFAGGAVRDALLKREAVEMDIATSALPKQVQKLFEKTIPTGIKHGTVTVRLDGMSFEVTTFRSEGKYLDHRHPGKVHFLTSPQQDAKRRDFTINALFFDPVSKKLYDFVEGLPDLQKKIIRLVGDPNSRIEEDALRLLRAVRFATVLNFDLEKETRKAVRKRAKLIQKISAERIKQELDLIIASPRAAVGFGVLDIFGLMQYILPEIKNLQGVKQPKNQHSEGDVYAHSLLALEKVDKNADLVTRYGVLFHDLGKPQTRQIRNGKITFYNHQNVGAELAKKIGTRLKFSNADISKLTWLVKNHMVPHDLQKMKLSTRRKWALNQYFPSLLEVYRSDVRASFPATGKPAQNPKAYRLGLRLLDELEKKPSLKKPILSGNDVMRILKIKEGPQVGKILKILEEKKLSGRLRDKKQAEIFLKTLNMS